jgi:hypothetical protein
VNLSEFADALVKAADAVEDHGAIDACDEVSARMLEELHSNTPVLTGALMESERVDSLTGDGASATAVVSTHLPLYARFRERGGTIYARHLMGHSERLNTKRDSPYQMARLAAALGRQVLDYSPDEYGGMVMGFLRWESDGGVHFKRKVTQEGSWYMKRTVDAMNDGLAGDIARDKVFEIIHDAGV